MMMLMMMMMMMMICHPYQCEYYRVRAYYGWGLGVWEGWGGGLLRHVSDGDRFFSSWDIDGVSPTKGL
jgi:hypothetical protein